MPELGKATYVLELSTGPLDAGLAQAEARTNASVERIGRTLTSAGRRISSAGRSLSTALTAPVLLAGGAAVKMGLDFERSLTNIDALVGASDQQMKQYRESIIEVTKIGTTGPKQVADALYFITSSGFEGASALDVLRVSGMAAAAGLGSIMTVADAVTSAVNAYGEAALSAGAASDVLVATIREGKGEPEELAGAIGRVIAPAQNMGVEFNEVGAALAALSLVGLDFNEGTTALRGALTGLLKPTQETREFLEGAGESVQGLREELAEKGLIPTLIRLATKFRGNADAIGTLFPNVRALNGFLALTGANANKTQAIMDAMTGSVGDTAKAYEVASEAIDFKFDNALANIKLSLTEIGSVILPQVADGMQRISGYVSSAADAFSGLSPKARDFLLFGILLAAALGPVLLALGGLVTVIGGVASAIAVVATPVGALVAAIVALVAAIALAKAFPDQFATALQAIGLSAEDAEMLVDSLAHAFDTLLEAARIVWPFIRTSIVGTLEMIGHSLNVIIGLLTLDFSRAWSGIKGWMTTPLRVAAAQIRNIVNGIKRIFVDLWDGMKEKAIRAALAIIEPFTHLPWRLGKWARDAKNAMQAELDQLNAQQAADRASKGFADVWIPGMERAGKEGKKALQRSFADIDTDRAAKKAADGFVRVMGPAGTKSGDAFGKNLVAAMDPWFLLGAQHAGNVFDRIDASMKKTLDDLANAFTGLAPVVWDGKVWRDAQGKVLKDQQKAWDAWNAKMKQSAIMRKPPPKGTQVMLRGAGSPTRDVDYTRPTGGAGGAGGTGGGDSFALPDRFKLRETRAARTPGTADDLAVLRDEERYLRGLISNRKVHGEKLLQAEQELTRVVNDIQRINDDVSKTLGVSTELPPWLQRRMMRAQATEKNLKDDVTVLKMQEAYFKKLLQNRKLTRDEREKIKNDLLAVQLEIKRLNKEIAGALDTGTMPELTTPGLRIRETLAERTPGKQDDINAQQARLAYLNKLLRKYKGNLEIRATIMEEITAVLQRIADLQEEMGKSSGTSGTSPADYGWAFLGERQSFMSNYGSNVFHDTARGRMPGTSQLAPKEFTPILSSGAKKRAAAVQAALDLSDKAGMGGIAGLLLNGGRRGGAGGGLPGSAGGTGKDVGRGGAGGQGRTGATGGAGGKGAALFGPGNVQVVKLETGQFSKLIAAITTGKVTGDRGVTRLKRQQLQRGTLAGEVSRMSRFAQFDKAPRQLVLQNQQHFNRETPDRFREARLAMTAMNAVMSGASFDG